VKPHHLRDMIACSTMDARDPVVLTEPLRRGVYDDVEPAQEVKRVLPRCPVCRVRDCVDLGNRLNVQHASCGEPSCQRAQRLRFQREHQQQRGAERSAGRA
jgi:hypothetical protein